MPSLGSFTPAVWMDYLPAAPRDSWASIREQGAADQTTLFFPSVYPEVPLRMVITGATTAALDNQIATLRAMRKTKVQADDSIRRIAGCLVLGIIAGPATPSPVIIGGTNAADVMEQEIVVVIQPPSPDLA